MKNRLSPKPLMRLFVHRKVLLFPLTLSLILALTLAMALFSPCDALASEDSEEEPGSSLVSAFPSLTEEKVRISLPESMRDYLILWVSDLHLIAENDPEVREEYREKVKERRALMTDDGLFAERLWQDLPEALDQYHADLIVFGGDLLDYMSLANLSLFQEGLDRLKTPWIYLRADHDYGRWYGDMTLSEMRKAQGKTARQKKLWLWETEDFLLAGLDNTTSILTDETIDSLEDLAEKEKPIILLTHVPLDQTKDLKKVSSGNLSLAETSEQGWEGRALLWGEGDYYDSSNSENMTRLLELVRGKDSPFVEVLAGHLHLSWDGLISETCREHVFSPAFQGTVGVITVSGGD